MKFDSVLNKSDQVMLTTGIVFLRGEAIIAPVSPCKRCVAVTTTFMCPSLGSAVLAGSSFCGACHAIKSKSTNLPRDAGDQLIVRAVFPDGEVRVLDQKHVSKSPHKVFHVNCTSNADVEMYVARYDATHPTSGDLLYECPTCGWEHLFRYPLVDVDSKGVAKARPSLAIPQAGLLLT